MSTHFDILDLGWAINHARLRSIQNKRMLLDELETDGTKTGLWVDASNGRGF